MAKLTCSYECFVFDNSYLKIMAECSVIGLNDSCATLATWQIWQGHNWVVMVLDYNELEAALLVDGISVCSLCFFATNERGSVAAIRMIQLPWDPGDSLNLDMIHPAAHIHTHHMMLLLPWDPGGCAITLGDMQDISLSLQHINREGRALSKRTIVHALHLCLPWDPGGLAWFRLEGKPKIMGEECQRPGPCGPPTANQPSPRTQDTICIEGGCYAQLGLDRNRLAASADGWLGVCALYCSSSSLDSQLSLRFSYVNP